MSAIARAAPTYLTKPARPGFYQSSLQALLEAAEAPQTLFISDPLSSTRGPCSRAYSTALFQRRLGPKASGRCNREMWPSLVRFIVRIELSWWIFVESFLLLFTFAADQAVAIEASRPKGNV